jgi:hypothetical protein
MTKAERLLKKSSGVTDPDGLIRAIKTRRFLIHRFQLKNFFEFFYTFAAPLAL